MRTSRARVRARRRSLSALPREDGRCYSAVRSAQDLLTLAVPWKATSVNRQEPGQRGSKVSVFLMR